MLAVVPAVWGQNGLSITNYSLVSQARYTRTQSYFTYRADLINPGAALAGVTATVTSLVPAVQVVAGQGTLHFAPVPANSRTTSADTFTLLVDTTVRFDFASLSWSFANPVANPGPNQTAAVGTTVVLNGSGSTNPAGAGPLTYSWTIVSRPVNSRAQLANSNSVITSFLVDAEGSYSISLTVSNGTASDTALVSVSTVNSPPVANAGPNQTVSLGATVVLNGSLSADADGDPLTYSWSLVAKPAGSTAVISNVHVVSPTFVADQPGSYIAQLVVNDGTSDSAPS
ncbi:MAG TPA: PKD domain-containing protein, partial [Bryobacteraceae bacterium]|nr:PKD domain-containing protein [Bryobacteraceae bacterium]